MLLLHLSLALLTAAPPALAQDAVAAAPQEGAGAVQLDFADFNFDCPERNGLFPDPEQCDLYYVCEDGLATPQLCKDGELFDDSVRNRERCKLPHGVDCGAREYVQEPTPGLDPRCPRANGIFDHEDPDECGKFYTCSEGGVFEMECVATLFFDNEVGGCVRKEELSRDSKKCGPAEGEEPELKSIDGFTCPGKAEVGPQGLLQAHPVFAHPADCRYFFTCFFGTDPNKFGCSEGQVFDEGTQVCKPAEEVRECACWYECPEDCETGECAPDCTCLSREDLAQLTTGVSRRRK